MALCALRFIQAIDSSCDVQGATSGNAYRGLRHGVDMAYASAARSFRRTCCITHDSGARGRSVNVSVFISTIQTPPCWSYT
eukprot:7936-Heterococcus_DN1.PRE.2